MDVDASALPDGRALERSDAAPQRGSRCVIVAQRAQEQRAALAAQLLVQLVGRPRLPRDDPAERRRPEDEPARRRLAPLRAAKLVVDAAPGQRLARAQLQDDAVAVLL